MKLARVVAVALALFLLAPLARAQEATPSAEAKSGAPAPATPTPTPAETPASDGSALTVKPGNVSGSVVDLDGKTGVSDVKVRLADSKDPSKVREVATDTGGAFVFTGIEKGSYDVTIGNTHGKVEVKDGAPAMKLKFVLDPAVARGGSPKPVAPAPASEQSDDSGIGLPLVLAVIIIGALVVGVAVAVTIIVTYRPHVTNNYIVGSPPVPTGR